MDNVRSVVKEPTQRRFTGAYLLLAALLVVGCGGSTASTSPSPVAVATPTPTGKPLVSPSPTLSAIVEWPTVAQARERLTGLGYELVNDTAATGENRWTSPDTRNSPFEILGDEDAPATVAIVVDPLDAEGMGKHMDAALGLFVPDDRITILDLMLTAVQGILDGEEDSHLEEVLSKGRVKVSRYGSDSLYVIITPFGLTP